MTDPSRLLSALAQTVRLLRLEKTSTASRVEQLYEFLFENRSFRGREVALGELAEWSTDQLQQALDVSFELVARYTHEFYDPRELPVTYYKRERRVRRHLDHELSRLYKELISRSGRLAAVELITEEPIYYLTQQARAKSFPKSRDGRASLAILRQRFHLDLSHRVDTGPDSRRVLLPHEIR